MKKILLSISVFTVLNGWAQKPAQLWADSVYNTLSPNERIAQLMVVRLSERTGTGVRFYDQKVLELVKKYNIGGVCLFQGGPVWQANAVNKLQANAKTPILMCIDGEWGVGQRFDSVLSLPKPMMLGALPDAKIVYEYGKIIGEQCKRAGIQVNYGPVMDVNNNPNNPVINDRSFGEDKYKVALFGTQYMKGMQDAGVMACAKHFPGHGDVEVDSHNDLPVINKSMKQLEELELYPFQQIFNAGVGSVMIAHLSIPSIDNTANKPTSISYKNVTELMRNKMGYQGLTFTDALEMQGVKKFYPGGEASVQSIIAGNDMLCLPGDVPLAIAKINEAIKKNKISWQAIELHCKKVLAAKYEYGLNNWQPVSTVNITADLNSKVNGMIKLVAENALTLLRNSNNAFFPLVKSSSKEKDIVYVAIGASADNAATKRMRTDYNADVFFFNYKQDAGRILSTVELIKRRYKKVVIGIHNFSRYPAGNFGISKSAVSLASRLQNETNALTLVFGNPYAIKNFCSAKNLIACYEDDPIIQNAAVDLLQGKISPKGKLPVTVCDDFQFGSGIDATSFFLPRISPGEAGLNPFTFLEIDSIVMDGIQKGAYPGCVLLVAKDGKIVYNKAYGNYTYEYLAPVQVSSVFDMASVTKIFATTISLMKLYDEGKFDLNKKLGNYLSWVRGTNKENLSMKDILTHQAGLLAFIPFYKEIIDSAGLPSPLLFSSVPDKEHPIRVAENLYMKQAWADTMYQRILQSPVDSPGKYVYSDNDFIFLGKIVEALSGKALDEFVTDNFYRPMGLMHTGFKPKEHIPVNTIMPTEKEKFFRLQQLVGDVHDPGAAMFGGVAGHAGLFSNSYELAVIAQMLLNGGHVNGKSYLKKSTIDLFTAYQSKISRRGYGFDKPEKDNATRPEPYPCLTASAETFGHTGFTGTCVWMDPKHNLTYIFLSNRVYPDGGENRKLLNMNIRPKIQQALYRAMGL